MIRSGDLAIDKERYTVTVDGDPVHLTYMEFNALWFIANQEGRVATYDQLARALWGEPSPRSRRRLAVLISRMRAKLGGAGSTHIATVTRVGYRFIEPAEAA